MSESTRPNVLFVFADQMRRSALGCMGNGDVATPHLDQLAEQGLCATRAVANCPLCGPSRASILTGRYPLSHRVVSNWLPLPHEERTFGELFGERGWATGYIGKWHLEGAPNDVFTPPGAGRHGFGYWAAFNNSHRYFQGYYYDDAGQRIQIDGYEPDHQTDLAIDFMRRHREDPWMLILSWGPPHFPYEQVPERFRQQYAGRPLEMPPNVPAPEELESTRQVPWLKAGPQAALRDYYAQVTALDADMGRLLAALDDLGLADSTIVVFTSDHGDMLYSHGYIEKYQPWEESVGIPLLVRYPGRIAPGRTSSVPTSTVDLLPSLLGLAGIAVPPEVQGSDLSAEWLRDPGDARPDSTFLLAAVPDRPHWPFLPFREWRAVRTARHSYACDLQGPWLLYDNEADPYQMHNLVGDPAHRATQARLHEELQQWLRSTGDRFVPWREHIRSMGLVDLWNYRERCIHPKEPELLDP